MIFQPWEIRYGNNYFIFFSKIKNRWSKIAENLPGRSYNDVKNYWRTKVQKHAKELHCEINNSFLREDDSNIWNNLSSFEDGINIPRDFSTPSYMKLHNYSSHDEDDQYYFHNYWTSAEMPSLYEMDHWL
uniref:Uncharacterized protein n=1 Tax=Solanum lycopersicum TaxID=4081 RepID=A0A3Q7GS49_SOLLC